MAVPAVSKIVSFPKTGGTAILRLRQWTIGRVEVEIGARYWTDLQDQEVLQLTGIKTES